jgi:CRP-like cAMP-binding protein
MDDSQVRTVLAKAPLFAEVLDDRLVHTLAAKSRPAVFPEGATLMAEGDFGATMFVIAQGQVAVTVADKRGDEHDVAHVGAGGIVGEMSLMTGMRRNASVTALTEVSAIEITKVALEDVLSMAPELIDSFGASLSRRQAERDRVAHDAESEATIVQQIRKFFPAIFGGR